MKNLFIFRMKAFVLSVIFLIGISGVLWAKPIAIIDAGSSGSRLYVYDVENDGIKWCYVLDGKFTALSDFNADQSGVGTFLNNMTTAAAANAAVKSKFPGSGKIPLYILATAGMRLVTNHKAIYDRIGACRDQIDAKFQLVEAKTISGQYEGLCAWIAVNCKNRKLAPTASGWVLTPDSFGIVEIGGASMQIAFAAKTAAPGENIIDLRGIKIYSKSYLGAGVNIREVDATKLTGEPGNYPDAIQFFGLGGLTGIAIDCMKNPKHPVDEPIKERVRYISWVLGNLNLTTGPGPRVITKLDDAPSWTVGAALDITISGCLSAGSNFNPARPN